ncbi:MAG: VCBS repeat-containing protein [Deltaproteobacteria bacterium]|nr:VCBS repeat-containing protein [Deltaproteobacteria bacterium]
MLLVLFTTGCSDLPDIEAGSCGNGVIDVGEDCDGASDLGEGTQCGAPESGAETACFLVCIDDAVCPDGWGCGTDGRCRQPSGELDEPTAWDFQVGSFGVGDFDGDGSLDLVGNTSTTLTVRYGSPEAAFPEQLDLFIRQPAGPLTYADISGDGLTDVVVPIGGGLFSFLGTGDRLLDPVAYAPFPLFGNSEVRLVPVPVENEFDSTLLVLVDTAMFFLAGQDGEPTVVPLPAGKTVEDIAGRIPSAAVGVDSGGPQLGRFTAALAMEATPEVWLVTSKGSGDNIEPEIVDAKSLVDGVNPVSLPPGVVVSPRGAQFAEVDNNNGIDLLIDVVDDGRPASAVAFKTAGPGSSFDDPVLVDVPIDGTIRSVERVLAVGRFDRDNIPDFVTPDGVFASCAPATLCMLGTTAQSLPALVYSTGAVPAGEAWAEAVVGDFNGDGDDDFAATVAGGDGIFVFLQTPVGLFNPFAVATDDPATELRVGDFDGDLIDDLAFVERDSEGDEVWVAFGSVSGGMSEPVRTGEFGKIESFQPTYIRFSESEVDLVRDLLVVSLRNQARSLAILQGSSTRRLISPFLIEGAIITSALVGRFSESGVQDMFAVGLGVPASNESAVIENSLWLLRGLGEGLFDSSSLTNVVIEDQLNFDPFCSVWASADVDGDSDGLDEVMALDARAGCGAIGKLPTLVVGKATPGAENIAEVEAVVLPDDALRAVTKLLTVDADGDGDQDLMTVFEGGDGSGAEGGIAVYWNDDAGGFGAASAAVEVVGAQVRGAAVVQFDGDSRPELLVLSSLGLFVSRLEEDGKSYSEPELVRQGNWRGMEVADFNNDGVSDVALLLGGQVEIRLGIPAAPRGSEGQLVRAISEDGQ